MIILLSLIGITSVLASDEFLIKQTRDTGDVDAQNNKIYTVTYLLVKPLGRKKLFGTPEWSKVRGTPVRWLHGENKIQVMGAFKKKNLCLFFKGNKNSPFTIKNCNGMFDNESMKIGCDTTNTKIGKFQYSDGEAEEDDTKMIAGFTDQDGDSICDVTGKDTEPLDNPGLASQVWYDAKTPEEKAKLFRFEKAGKYFAVRQAPHDCSGVEGEDNYVAGCKRGNEKTNQYQWERHVAGKVTNAAWMSWNGKQIEVVYPTDARIDGKPLCLEMGKTGKMPTFPYKVQKCDRTVDRGNFGCSTHDATKFGTAWNAKRYDQAVADSDAEKTAFHLDKLDTMSYNGASICSIKDA